VVDGEVVFSAEQEAERREAGEALVRQFLEEEEQERAELSSNSNSSGSGSGDSSDPRPSLLGSERAAGEEAAQGSGVGGGPSPYDGLEHVHERYRNGAMVEW
jgi:hypothetical protein